MAPWVTLRTQGLKIQHLQCSLVQERLHGLVLPVSHGGGISPPPCALGFRAFAHTPHSRRLRATWTAAKLLFPPRAADGVAALEMEVGLAPFQPPSPPLPAVPSPPDPHSSRSTRERRSGGSSSAHAGQIPKEMSLLGHPDHWKDCICNPSKALRLWRLTTLSPPRPSAFFLPFGGVALRATLRAWGFNPSTFTAAASGCCTVWYFPSVTVGAPCLHRALLVPEHPLGRHNPVAI